jgi:gas vesicle protein
MSKGAFVTGFLVGGLTGAAAALLMTPQSGEDVRTRLQERGIELKAQVGDLTAGAKGQAGQFKTQVGGLTAGAREQAEQLKAKIQERGRTVISEETIEASAEQGSE